MAEWLAELYRSVRWETALIVPVPLATGRLKSRGYNQVHLITNALGNALRVPQSENALTRVRDTPSQVGLEPFERRRNVVGAFRASSDHVSGKKVLVVDDLFTTGATLAACAAALKQAGAASVLGLTVGRTWN
jgi:ComF family protein